MKTFLEMTQYLMQYTPEYKARKNIISKTSAFIAMLEIAINEKQVLSIKIQYENWINSLKQTKDEKANIFLEKSRQAIHFASGIVSSPENLIKQYSEELELTKVKNDIGLIQFHIGCAQIFTALKEKDETRRRALIIESQKSFNLSEVNWKEKSDLNFWRAVSFHLLKDFSSCDAYLTKYFIQSKNVTDMLLDDNYLLWLKAKLPSSFLSKSKKMYTIFLNENKKHESN